MTYDKSELDILRALDRVVRESFAAEILSAAASRAEEALATHPMEGLAWESIPLSIYRGTLPSVIRSSWVFVIRAGSDSGAERHPNSHQRMVSWRGSGDIQTSLGVKWTSHMLKSDTDGALEERWISIPPNMWHRAVVSGENWIVVSFHTVAAEDLIEERPGESGADSPRQRKYLEEE